MLNRYLTGRPAVVMPALFVAMLGLVAVALLVSPTPDVDAQSPPATPSSVTLTRADGTVTASGYAVGGATKYHITYSTDGGGSWHAPVSNHTNWTSTSITFGADNNKSYIVGVRAGNDQGWSGWRNSPTAGPYQPEPTATPTPQPSPPATPSSVTLTRADGTVTASGYAVSGATKYHITYSADGGGSWQAPVSNHTNWTFTSITFGADNDKSYIVGVRAGNAQGWSGWRNSPTAGPYQPEPTPAPTSTPTPIPTSTPTPTPSQPPDTPASVSVTRSDGAITASWPPVSGATGYTLTYSAVGDGEWTTAASNHAGNSFTISGLNNDYTYLVGASASNAAGQSGSTVSPASGPYSNKKPSAPPSVTILRADGQLTAFWNSGYGAESYHVTYSSDYGKTWTLAASSHPVGNGTTQITVKNLDNSKQYTVGVRARNKNGYSGWRNSSPSGPYVPIVAPPKPRNVTAYASDKAVTFIWDKPGGFKGEGEVTGYQAAYWLNPGVCGWPAKVPWYNIPGSDGDTVYHTIEGLTNDEQYGVALRALNQSAPGPGVGTCLTPIADLKPPPFVPPAPKKLNLIRGDGTLTVTWHHAATALGYQVDYSTDGGKTWAMAVWWNNTTSVILRGMDNAAAYTVRVRGRNNRGDGPWSGSVTDTPPPVSVSNLSETESLDGSIGIVGSQNRRRSVGFTTGANNTGYTLRSVTLKFKNIFDSPTGLTAAIHTASGGNPAASAIYTLTGSNPVANTQNTWSCTSDCSLDASTEYFLVLSLTDPSSGGTYLAELTRSDDETNTPANAGWSIANVIKISFDGVAWTDSGLSDTLKFKVTATVK